MMMVVVHGGGGGGGGGDVRHCDNVIYHKQIEVES